MSRWSYDVVFYRVFCVTLISTAIIFTLILTNIFIDIDGLLSNKKKAIPLASNDIGDTKTENDLAAPDDQSDIFYNDDSNYDGDFNPAQRTKRSTETENILLQVRNPLMKKLITNKLAKLLEELDKEEPKPKEVSQQEFTTEKEVMETKNKLVPKTVAREELMHIAMHNILLQGLIGHMDLNDVFKKVHSLYRNLNNNAAIINEGKIIESTVESRETNQATIKAEQRRSFEEHKLFDEIMNCKELKKEILQHHENKTGTQHETSTTKADIHQKIIIRTVIEINDTNHVNTSHPKDIEGLIKLIYNGKPIKLNQMTEKIPESKISLNNRYVENITASYTTSVPEVTTNEPTTDKNDKKEIKNPLNVVIEEYLKKHPFPNFYEEGGEIRTFETKRLKRQIKIRYFNDNRTSTIKSKQIHNKTKKADDDLYIEIETHFDGKGVKGEKKKKLVKSLIEKIQKALNSDIEQPNKKERIKFIKRIQDPIDFKEHSIILNKVVASYEPIAERLLNPIGRTLDTNENILKTFGESWKKKVNGPNFLTASKSVNSAEMGELNIDFDSVLRNGIPKRLQKPLNAELINEDETTMTSADTGNVSLFLKDIDGTGFSIGINQYVGEPPDRDSMRIFSGIENLINEYHKTYDQEDVSNESNIDKEYNFVQKDHTIAKRGVHYVQDDLNDSTKEMDSDYHSNTYKMYLEGNALSGSKSEHLKNVPIVIDGRILSKNLKPSEILSLANFAKRKKRAINVKKISSLKSKIKLNRYINTNAMANKKIFLKNKRNKRQIQKIRIIARSNAEVPKSDEKIFLISRENTYSDKVMKDIEDPETVIDKRSRDINDETIPFEDFFKMQNPEAPPIFSDNEYETKVRPSLIMSKYPHLFMEDIANIKNEESKDPYLIERNARNKQYRIKHGPKQSKARNRIEATTVSIGIFDNEQKVNDFVNAILPPISKAKYKVTVKVSPKNISTNSGFKEVYTSVNKSFDQNGLRYYSVLNVSEISKVEKLNKSERRVDVTNDYRFNSHLIEQQQHIKTLLRLHKKRIDQQLTNLVRESKYLESMMKENSDMNINKTLKILKDNDDERYEVKDDKINKILDSVKKLEETYKTTTSTTTQTTTTPIENDKIKLIDTIKLNEKVTYEILKKIDTNTNILKTFLQKFENKLDDNLKQSTEGNFGDVNLDMTKDWKLYNVKDKFFIGDESKNDTVPFIYAYQQQLPIQGKEKPLASLMYHGHIHTKPVQDINHNNFKKANKIDTDNSTFFVKELDDFNTKSGPYLSANININTTSV